MRIVVDECAPSQQFVGEHQKVLATRHLCGVKEDAFNVGKVEQLLTKLLSWCNFGWVPIAVPLMITSQLLDTCVDPIDFGFVRQINNLLDRDADVRRDRSSLKTFGENPVAGS